MGIVLLAGVVGWACGVVIAGTLLCLFWEQITGFVENAHDRVQSWIRHKKG